jgi:long-chain acyl-CoA synthetase
MATSIYQQFHHCAAANPHSLAVRFMEARWDYEHLDHEVVKTASRLSALGLRKGDVVAVLLPNCLASLTLFYAISALGGVSYLIHPLTPPEELVRFVKKSDAKAVVLLSGETSRYKEALIHENPCIIAINPFEGASFFQSLAYDGFRRQEEGVVVLRHAKEDPKFSLADVEADADAVYLNTGGTNGEPKIVVLTNEAINNLGMKGYPLIGGEVKAIKMLTAIPMFHGFGLVMGVHTPLSNGASTVLLLKFRTKDAIQLIKDGEATAIIGVPTLYNALLSRDAFYGEWLKKQIIAFVGGDSVPESLLARWNETMVKYGSEARLYQGYGLTETVNVSNVNTKAHHRFGSVGLPLPGLEEKIVDVETRQEVPSGQCGEILIGGDTLMKGYLHDPKLTAESFLTLGGKRFVSTRDYGYLDKDGYLYFKQRLRRIVKINGETVCPTDVEKVALSFFEIYEAYCYGVLDEKKGNVLHLALVIRRGYEKMGREVIADNLRNALERQLTKVYMPTKILFLDSLPKTPIGKMDDNLNWTL